MNRIKLIKPEKDMKEAALDYIDEHQKNSELKLSGSGGLRKAASYEEWLSGMKNYEPGKVPADTYFAVRADDGRLVGMIQIRHFLNEYLLNVGGNIGYGVRPSERRKGYASEMLSIALDKCRGLGMDKALITCNKTNIASAKTIISQGGIYENSFVEDDGTVVDRYWITL